MGFIGALAKTVVFAVPVSATFFDLVGTVVAVEGVSMQVKLQGKCTFISVKASVGERAGYHSSVDVFEFFFNI